MRRKMGKQSADGKIAGPDFWLVLTCSHQPDRCEADEFRRVQAPN
jgi:hypothetical protein